MKKKKRKIKSRNCKHGLDSRQELLARKIRQDLLDDTKKEKHYVYIMNLRTSYLKDNPNNFSESSFVNYVHQIYPELYSAFKRLEINIFEIEKQIGENIYE